MASTVHMVLQMLSGVSYGSYGRIVVIKSFYIIQFCKTVNPGTGTGTVKTLDQLGFTG